MGKTTKDYQHSEAYYEGEMQFVLGHPRSSNPYTRGNKSFVDWLKGWNDANKRGY